MHNVKSIRERLALTQGQLAQGLGCTQGNVSFYERGQSLPPESARKLISFAATLGYTVTFDDIYGAPELVQSPVDIAQDAIETVAQAAGQGVANV